MRHRQHILRTLLLVAMSTAPAAMPLAFAGGAALPGGLGPWDVGRSSFTLVDAARGDRSMGVDVWYPVADSTGAEPSVYDLVFAQLPSPLAVADREVANAGPFPLVLFSHGSGGIRFQSFFLTEALASHGFIVAAIDHTGNTAADLVFQTTIGTKEITLLRRGDISFLLDELLELNDTPGSLLDGRIDASRIGLTGHSFGGFTTLATAGSYAGIAADLRIDAIAPFSPATGFLFDSDIANVAVPTLVLGGQFDNVTPISESIRVFELVSGEPVLRVDLGRAGHQSFTNLCDFAAVLLNAGIPKSLISFLLGNLDQGCTPDLIAPELAHHATRHFIVAFMQVHVAGRAGEYSQYLTQPSVIELGLPVKLYRRN